MAIPRPRDWRANWSSRTDEWWTALALTWRIVGCAMCARLRLDARDRYFSEWERVVDHRNRLVALLHEHEQRQDASDALIAELVLERNRLDEERLAIERAHADRAFDDDTIETATLREIVEQGITPYAFGRWANLDANSADIESTSEKTRAQNLRKELLAYYERHLAMLIDIFEDARAGAPIFGPLGSVVFDRHGRHYASRFSTPMDVAREIEKTTRAISVLTPRPTRQNRNR